MNGHTATGTWTVYLELSEDQVQQLIRSIEWAKMMDSHDDSPPDYQQDGLNDMQVIAHRAFLQEILNELYQAVVSQRKL